MKPVILTFTGYYLPGYLAGGPIRTIANMVERLSDDFDFRIVALDRDIGETESYSDLEGNSWMPRGRALVRYVSKRDLGIRRIAEIVKSTPHDAIYLNSFFDYRFTLQVLVARRLGYLRERPIVIAPRGQFSEGALQIKFAKKKAFIELAKLFKLYDGLTWQASSIHEVDDLQRVMSVGTGVAGDIVVARNLAGSGNSVTSSDSALARINPDGVLRVCFLSRISPMKNLDCALRVLQKVRIPVRFTIYGPIEDKTYWAECQKLIEKLPASILVVHKGLVEPAQVIPTLAQHDLFLLPTRGENFGHVIHEALRAGLPVLISDQTPWRGLAPLRVGWDLSLGDESGFVKRIEEAAAWTESERQRCSARARAYAATAAEDPANLEANRRLFLDVIHDSAVGIQPAPHSKVRNVQE